ncbi:flagellar export chaperone FliS [Parendozoicomonas haliclonae]|uniref:Flagellar secretion chaperone FliS n=1 Tax=Parendozoicomonas haliclonae TaxID=1960125 RepID=A0A1X7AGE6_9GAMM|nr:flagellar export chaperone FliS [Parendozoicomonas haliclonae]SMA39849.1 Flagellar protein FliS [Parendozoicomonas haliclonae]
MSNGLTAYRNVQSKAQAETADPYKLIQLLFQELMVSLARVKGCMERNQPDQKGDQISHCIEILMALDSSLNVEAGGELAENLRSLYRYSVQQLLAAGPENSLDKVTEVIGLMKSIREAWDGIGKQAPAPLPKVDQQSSAGVSGHA